MRTWMRATMLAECGRVQNLKDITKAKIKDEERKKHKLKVLIIDEMNAKTSKYFTSSPADSLPAAGL